MSGKRYTEEIRIEAANQMVDRSYSDSSAASRMGTATKSLYEWTC